MDGLTDQQLLQDYAERKSEAAFAELARRYVDLAYSAALRMVGDAHAAKDVTQEVFVALAANARQLAGHPVLAGWLHQTTRNIAANSIRANTRRSAREQEAAIMNEILASEVETGWKQIAPQLDDALHELSKEDRDALLLRYFKGKSAQEIAATLGVSSEAAQKRVTRAVERLRELFARRGIAVGAGGLAVVLSANAVQAAPAGLVASISTAAAGTALASGATTIIKTIAMTTMQKSFIAATLAVVAGAGLFEAHQAAQMKNQFETLQQQQAPLREQVQQMQREHDSAASRLAAITDELERAKGNNAELLRLRNEVTALKRNQTGSQSSANISPLPGSPNQNNATAAIDGGRELGMAVVRGEAGAFDKLLAESKAEHQSFDTNSPGLSDEQRGEISRQTFAPINAAFKVIGEAGTGGNQQAIDALVRSLQTPELIGLAVHSLGGLAANGDPGALDVLVHPEKYGALTSSTVPALQPAADNGNQQAIDALAAIASNQKNQPLWLMTANSLSKAAASGNQTAVDALISMSSTQNPNIQQAVAQGLRGAAANQNAKAADALGKMNFSR